MPRRPYPIAFFLTSFDIGGTERQMVELMRRLDRREFEVHVACFRRQGALEPQVTEAAASVEAFPIDGFLRASTALRVGRFARWCRRIGAQIVHTCDLYANVFGLPGALLAGTPLRVGSRRELRTADKTRAQFAVQRTAYHAAHLVVANSTAAARELERDGVPAGKTQVIPNGLNFANYSAVTSRPSLRRIITVANLRAEKGHDTLIDAAPRIVERHPDVEFIVVGDGPLRGTLMQQVALRGLNRHFSFLGERQDVPALLASSDLFVLPSRTEACPNSVLEAMAVGLPIVATSVGGVPELLGDGLLGTLVSPDSPDALAAAILCVIDHPTAAAAKGRAARTRAERNYSLDRMVESFSHLYRAGLEQHAGERAEQARFAAS